MKNRYSICGNIVDVVNKKIFTGTITVENGIIKSISKSECANNFFILPGFVDAHVHIESSMLIPSKFTYLAVKNGTVATVSDPHEIANVLGIEGIKFMIENAKQSPLKIYFGAPSCVPATPFETSGAIISAKEIEILFRDYNLTYLSEVMNFPGVINQIPDVIEKINIAKKYNRVIDGHAPGLRGEDLEKYIKAGIQTDHEAYTFEEAEEKIQKGMKILIREGSAAKNFEALHNLIDKYPEQIMFCTDDSHPDDLVEGHINKIVAKAINLGHDLFNTLRAATVNPKKFYKLQIGLLQPLDPADFIIVNNLQSFDVIQTYINGKLVYDNGKFFLNEQQLSAINNFNPSKISPQDLIITPEPNKKIKVIKAYDGELITDSFSTTPKIQNNNIISDTQRDILKLVVLNRYKPAKPSIAFINGFNLKKGAIALSIAHDSHNILAVGTTDQNISLAINKLIDIKGGIVVFDENNFFTLSLPFAGLMTDNNPFQVAEKYKNLNKKVQELGSTLKAPFMTLSFMALLVIPKLKLSDKGLFDGTKFQFTSLFE